MRVACISGSYKKDGNTSLVIKSLVEKLENSGIPNLKIKKISLSGVRIHPCRGCEKCRKSGKCVIKDDFHSIVKKIQKSDLIIIGSPVYFHDVCGQIKNLVDRSFSLWHEKQLRGKRVIPVAVSAELGEERTLETLRIWAQAHEMKIIRSVSGHGYKPGDVKNDEQMQRLVDATINDLICTGNLNERDIS
ncbi:MAG: flavodoxin family protein [Methanomicrobiales archaeon]|nr:flavodoxin family protein [Methanomicrobiales archaeon]